VSRLNAKVRCNYYPLPLREAERIRNLLRFPIEPFSTLDPCVGDSAGRDSPMNGATGKTYMLAGRTECSRNCSGRMRSEAETSRQIRAPVRQATLCPNCRVSPLFKTPVCRPSMNARRPGLP
jgi:hypothetical protein